MKGRAPATALVPGTPAYRESQRRVRECPEVQADLLQALRLFGLPAVLRSLTSSPAASGGLAETGAGVSSSFPPAPVGRT